MASRSRALLLLALAVAAGAGCTVKKTETPKLSGPSEFSLSLTMLANPDTLNQDGFSESLIAIQARDANGQPVKSLPLRVEIAVGGVVQDFGRLSSKNVVTGGDGRATVTYTAPQAVDSVDRQTLVTIQATPSGSDATAQLPRSITIKLVPAGVITPPGGTAPDFTITPEAPLVGQTVTVVAPDTADIVSYAWDFGDGTTAEGRIAQHEYGDAGDAVITLTTTNSTGGRGTRSKSVNVLPGLTPFVNFVYSPTDAAVNTEVFFNASGSTPGPGRTLVSYKWAFGDGSSGSGVVTSHKYKTLGTFMVTLKVTDDAGTTGSSSQGLIVSAEGTGGVFANFTFSPTSPAPGSPVNFNAASSTSTDPIVTYAWDWGDGASQSGNDPTVGHTFGAAGDYVVTLTIKDSKGRTSTMSKTVSVS